MIVGIFARPNHPEGYGLPPTAAGSSGRAHGYVNLLVRCADEAELQRVADRLREPFYGIPRPDGEQYWGYDNGYLMEWYGGRFDMIAMVSGVQPWDITVFNGLLVKAATNIPERRFRSIGDNRYVGIFTAAEVIETEGGWCGKAIPVPSSGRTNPCKRGVGHFGDCSWYV